MVEHSLWPGRLVLESVLLTIAPHCIQRELQTSSSERAPFKALWRGFQAEQKAPDLEKSHTERTERPGPPVEQQATGAAGTYLSSTSGRREGGNSLSLGLVVRASQTGAGATLPHVVPCVWGCQWHKRATLPRPESPSDKPHRVGFTLLPAPGF